MSATTLYQTGTSLWHRLNPMTKIIYVITALLVPFFLGGSTRVFAMAIVSLVCLKFAGVFKKTLGILSISAFVLLTTLLIQGLFYAGNTQVIWSMGPIHFYKEGILFALGLCANVLNVLCAFSLLVLTTKPSDLVESFVRWGLSPKLGYVLLSVLMILPQMTNQVKVITEAQKSRGLETEGSLMKRFGAIMPLIGPVVLNALISTKERALALEVRGFSAVNAKTYLNNEPKSALDKPLSIGFTLLILATFVGRLIQWRL